MTSEELPVGAPVTGGPAQRPERVVREGRYINLVPLDAVQHGPSLFELSSGDRNAPLWTYMSDGPYYDYADFESALRKKADSQEAVFYAVMDRITGRARGYLSLMRIDVPNRVIEVGNVMYTPALQRTRGATEAIFLTAKYVFEELGYRRFEWKLNSLNAPSHRAARRFGFQFEGTFRQHMIIKGLNRDTAWYSMLDTEWPACRSAFQSWLEPGNFDSAGHQRISLTALRPE